MLPYNRPRTKETKITQPDEPDHLPGVTKKGFRMTIPEEKQQVRNANGSLLCDLLFADGSWNVTIKRKECYTTMTLMPDGSVFIEDTVSDRQNGKLCTVFYP